MVCLLVCHDRCKSDKNRSWYWSGCWLWPKEPSQMGSRSPSMKRQFWWRKGAGPGHVRSCLAVDILKATQ